MGTLSRWRMPGVIRPRGGAGSMRPWRTGVTPRSFRSMPCLRLRRWRSYRGNSPARLLREEGLAISRAAGYGFGEVRALIGIGVTAEWQGDLAGAAAHYEAAHTRVQKIEIAELGRMAHWPALANLGDLMLQGNPHGDGGGGAGALGGTGLSVRRRLQAPGNAGGGGQPAGRAGQGGRAVWRCARPMDGL